MIMAIIGESDDTGIRAISGEISEEHHPGENKDDNRHFLIQPGAHRHTGVFHCTTHYLQGEIHAERQGSKPLLRRERSYKSEQGEKTHRDSPVAPEPVYGRAHAFFSFSGMKHTALTITDCVRNNLSYGHKPAHGRHNRRWNDSYWERGTYRRHFRLPGDD